MIGVRASSVFCRPVRAPGFDLLLSDEEIKSDLSFRAAQNFWSQANGSSWSLQEFQALREKTDFAEALELPST